ncbi:MAG: phosphotransferase family protein, partial [Tepidiformaceae bacterium]
AELHALPVREGLDWGVEPDDLIVDEEVPLHRLGFAWDEREAAREPLAAARRAVLGGPFGFAHRDATAAHILLAPHSATLVDFERAGFGPQLFDVAAFLLTSGLEPAARRALAASYARLRGMEPLAAIDLIDLSGILWGIGEMLILPRRLIEALGDDAASERIRTCASRIDHGMRLAAGEHAVAAAIRRALWPG